MTETRVDPHEPPITTADLEGVGGTLGPEPEDFRVDEVELYPLSGEGEHLFVRVQKRLANTRDAVRAVARAAGVPESEVGSAGMKDRHAVTTQWLSLPARRARPVDSWELPEGMAVLESSRHGNKLRTGHLLGNRFRIRITGVRPGAARLAEAIVAALRERGLPNYFGAQRFGRGGGNLANALAWLEGERAGQRVRLQAFERKLFPSVIQSEVFNRYVTRRVAAGLSRPLAGEVVRLDGSGAMFVVEDVDRETPRFASRDVLPTGPMIGPKAKPAREQALALEREAALSLGLLPEHEAALGRVVDGTRRDVLVPLAELALEEADQDALSLEFFLPSGSYATQLVRELTREPFFRYSD